MAHKDAQTIVSEDGGGFESNEAMLGFQSSSSKGILVVSHQGLQRSQFGKAGLSN